MSLEKRSIEPNLHFFPTESRQTSPLAFLGLSSHPTSQVPSQGTCDVSPREQRAHGKTLFCHILDSLKGSIQLGQLHRATMPVLLSSAKEKLCAVITMLLCTDLNYIQKEYRNFMYSSPSERARI